MKKNEIVLVWIFVIVAILISFYFDDALIKYISFLRNGILDYFFLFITFIGSEIIIFFLLTALFLWRENKRRWIFPLWACMGISAIVGFILKVTIQRPRPFQLGLVQLLPILQEASFNVWDFSFPSFQTMLVFSAIPILSKEFPRLKKFWIAFAVLVAFSRVYFGIHFVSDVIAGAAIGYLIGILVLKLEKETHLGQKVYNGIFKR